MVISRAFAGAINFLLLKSVMGRMLILHFSDRDGILKVKLSNDIQLNTAFELKDHLSIILKYTVSDAFTMELLNDDGKFSALKDESIVDWQSNFLSVLITDLTPTLQSTPVLCIVGRAFDTSCGLSIVSDGSSSIIHIKVGIRAVLLRG